jgi:hypothetical protein
MFWNAAFRKRNRIANREEPSLIFYRPSTGIVIVDLKHRSVHTLKRVGRCNTAHTCVPMEIFRLLISRNDVVCVVHHHLRAPYAQIHHHKTTLFHLQLPPRFILSLESMPCKSLTL